MMHTKNMMLMSLHLTAADFYHPGHQMIFEAMMRVYRRREKVDLSSVVDQLTMDGNLQECGGRGYVVELGYQASETSGAKGAIELAKKYSDLRRIHDGCKQATEIIHSRHDVLSAQTILRAVVKPTGIGGCTDAGSVSMDQKSQGRKSAVSLVNDKTDCGGWPSGQTSMIGAYPGGGKTTLLLQDFAHAAEKGERVVYATFGDLDSREIMRKIMRQATGWSAPPKQSSLMTEDEWTKAYGDWKTCYDALIYEARTVRGGFGRKIGVFCDEMRFQHDLRPLSRVYVDYAQKIYPDKPSGNQVDDLQRISDDLKTLAEELDIPVIVGTQLTQTTEGPQPKGCRAIFEDCAVAVYAYWHNGNDTKSHLPIWSLARPDDGEDRVLLRLHKNRFGMLGRREYAWSDQYTKLI